MALAAAIFVESGTNALNRHSEGMPVATALPKDTPMSVRVLIVEDELLIAMDMQSQLERRGYRCRMAPDVGSAIKCIESGALDFAVLDVNLNGVNVAPVARELRARGVPFAYCTAYAGMLGPGEIEGVPVLGKPFSAEQLDLVISNAVLGEGDGLE